VGSVLVSGGTGTVPSYSASPTLTTSLTVPSVYGGTATSSTLGLYSTSGIGATDAINFYTGSQSLRMTINTSGNIGIGTTATSTASMTFVAPAGGSASITMLGAGGIIIGTASTGTFNLYNAALSVNRFTCTEAGYFTFQSGSSAVSHIFLTALQSANTGGVQNLFKATGGAHTGLTASTESSDIWFNLGRTVQFATGALATQRAVFVDPPTYGFVAGSTITNAATLAISGAPIAGTNATITNSYSLWSQSGAVNFSDTAITTSTLFSVSGTALTTGSAITVTGSTTTGIGALFTFDSLTTGVGLRVITTNNTSGNLVNFVGNSVTAGNIFAINAGALTTGSALNVAASTTSGIANLFNATNLTTGTNVKIESASTAGVASNSSILLQVVRTGANTNATHTAYGINASVANTGTTSINIAGLFSSTGATTNYAIIVPNASGLVGIGNSTPTYLVDVVGGDVAIGTLGNTLRLKVGSGGMIGNATLTAGTVSITIAGLTTSSFAHITGTVQGGTPGSFYTAVCTANTLTITSLLMGATNTLDTSSFNYIIFNPY